MRKIFLLLLLSLSGCLIFPHSETNIPAISGVIMDGLSPVRAAEVFFVRPSNSGEVCKAPDSAAITDDSGKITMEADSKLSWIIAIGDPLANWELCLKQGGVVKLLWANKAIGFVPKTLNFKCDISIEDFEEINGSFPGHGVCRFYK